MVDLREGLNPVTLHLVDGEPGNYEVERVVRNLSMLPGFKVTVEHHPIPSPNLETPLLITPVGTPISGGLAIRQFVCQIIGD